MWQFGGIYDVAFDKDVLKLGIYGKDSAIYHIKFIESALDSRDSIILDSGAYQIVAKNDISDMCARELELYFKGALKSFSVSYAVQGSAFELKVYKVLESIAYGATKSYSEIAKMINAPKASRAIGNACGKNALLFLIPCHRVILSNGKIGNYALGSAFKARLLALESRFI